MRGVECKELFLNILRETKLLSRLKILIELFETLNETDAFKSNFVQVKIEILVAKYTGQFISSSEISDLCGTVAGMVTPKGSISTEGETLQISVLPYRCSICPPLVTRCTCVAGT